MFLQHVGWLSTDYIFQKIVLFITNTARTSTPTLIPGAHNEVNEELFSETDSDLGANNSDDTDSE
jgi:hypothetical protein